MRCAVIVFPGSNCDSDLYKAVNAFEGVDAEYVWYTTENLDAFDLILLPGGFAYGDYPVSYTHLTLPTICSV